MCTSVNESLPLSICEAMASYKAIISTDVGDIKKLGINSNKVAKNYLNIASYSKKLCKILNSTFYY
jgi:glycosyltransferase involved in cell wall biosynthesis